MGIMRQPGCSFWGLARRRKLFCTALRWCNGNAYSEAFELPVEFHNKLGPIDVNWEVGCQFVHKGPDGWLTGLVIGHDFGPRLEGDMELHNQGTFHPSENQPTIELGGRYKIHRPAILLLMAGRSLEPARNNRSYFVGYSGIRFLLPSSSYKIDASESPRD